MDILVDDGNLALDAHGNLATVSGAAGLRQRIITHLRFWRGEWALDTDAGIPYYERVLGRQPLAVATATIATALRRIPGVRRIESLEVETSPDDRALTVRVSLDTDEGAIFVDLGI